MSRCQAVLTKIIIGYQIFHSFFLSHFFFHIVIFIKKKRRRKKSRIRETPTLSTDAESRTDTNLKRLRDLFNQWEAANWSCDHRANERPWKKSHGKGTNTQMTTHKQTLRLLDQLVPEGRVGENYIVLKLVGGGFVIYV